MHSGSSQKTCREQKKTKLCWVIIYINTKVKLSGAIWILICTDKYTIYCGLFLYTSMYINVSKENINTISGLRLKNARRLLLPVQAKFEQGCQIIHILGAKWPFYVVKIKNFGPKWGQYGNPEFERSLVVVLIQVSINNY